ncbi:Histone-lysine N-methyltransferase set-6 [Neophaeococcomyces mojaviensis]|uniref:Histone-lysine N-methyltransferase set-6 n=1 Tax=Neophaeococcomyces mojaviensis TaxID=3383035 RepID=A0ACC3A7A2_9EURO|nr:Histone-lysine N-methyltransferase set-6 [Knufia sp. JES_112]
MGKDHWQLPATDTLVIRDTPAAGRAVFARTDNLPGTHILSTSTELSPIAHVIFRPYRKEVCTQCFLYNRGREWKIRDATVGTAFCTIQCEASWRAANDEICLEASRAVETLIKTSHKRRSKHDVEEETTSRPLDGTSPRVDKISSEWSAAERLGESVVRARRTTKPTKTSRAILRSASEFMPDPDILTYALCGVLSAYKAQELSAKMAPDAHIAPTSAAELLPSLYQLTPDDRVFMSSPTAASPLEDYVLAYLMLLAVLPMPLLHLVSIDLIVNLASRASHNAFSIRPEGITDGDQSGEFLGWGVWPEASFFNHSCRPNVTKERKGRIWLFRINTTDLIASGQQLCITYLGGDERDLDVHERRKRLQEQWGFVCQCDRCTEESGETGLE